MPTTSKGPPGAGIRDGHAAGEGEDGPVLLGALGAATGAAEVHGLCSGGDDVVEKVRPRGVIGGPGGACGDEGQGGYEQAAGGAGQCVEEVVFHGVMMLRTELMGWNT